MPSLEAFMLPFWHGDPYLAYPAQIPHELVWLFALPTHTVSGPLGGLGSHWLSNLISISSQGVGLQRLHYLQAWMAC
jgi:hypothetical protein